MTRELRLTSEDRDMVESWIDGIQYGTWEPSEVTKRHLARILDMVLLGSNPMSDDSPSASQ